LSHYILSLIRLHQPTWRKRDQQQKQTPTEEVISYEDKLLIVFKLHLNSEAHCDEDNVDRSEIIDKKLNRASGANVEFWYQIQQDVPFVSC